MKNIKPAEFAKQAMIFAVAVVINSASLVLFLAPHNLSSSGVTGVAVILSYFTSPGLGLWVFLLNLPLMVFGVIVFKFKFFATTILAVFATSSLTELLVSIVPYAFSPFTDNVLLSAIIGGTGLGVASGLMFRAGSSMGGVDVAVKALRLKYKHMKTGKFYILLGAIVITAGALAFNDHTLLLYSTIVVFAMSFGANFVLYGSDEARMIYIITNNDSNIARRLTSELTLGVTYIQGKGAYSDNDKRVLLCAMRNHMVPKARQIVLEEDNHAFMIVTKASEVLGWGHKKLDSVDL